MTSLVAWVGVDSRGPASLYIASDSRASWVVAGKALTWDYCRKIFTIPGRPDVLGYAGPILLVSHTLSAVVDQIASGYVPYATAAGRRFEGISSRLRIAHGAYPEPLRRPYAVLYATRDGDGTRAAFHVFLASWTGRGWTSEELPVPLESAIVGAYGSGGEAARSWVRRWQDADVSGRTSRSVFSGLCDAIAGGEDPLTGGAPQLAGIYRTASAEFFGVVWSGARYVMGTPDSLAAVDPRAIEWRNRLFERCDGTTLLLLSGAQRHARPRSLRT